MAETTLRDAREAIRLVESEPSRAAAVATAVLTRALAAPDPAAAAVAARALGLAEMHVDRLDVALAHLRAAVRHGRRAGSPLLVGEARMTLAFVLLRRGRSRAALREIAGAVSDLAGHPLERARAEAQRGAILHQLGRFDDALAVYQHALPTLRRFEDHLWTLRVLSNRGQVHGHRQEFALAEADLAEAARLCRRLGLAMFAGFVEQNRGEVSALRGDISAALAHFHRAEERFAAVGSKSGSLLLDRGQVLLSVRLVDEAREAAEQAVAVFESEGRDIAIPQVRLLIARAAMVSGDPGTAVDQARRAARAFARQDRPEWAAAARWMLVSARVASADRHRVRIGQVERCVAELEAAGWTPAALEARLLAGRLAVERGRLEHGHRHLTAAARSRRSGPAAVRARAWYAQALARRVAGNHRGATSAVRAGLRILDAQRASLGATDLRAHVSGHRVDLVDLGLGVALGGGRPDRVFAWAERGRAGHLLLRPARPATDPVLAETLAELRATARQIFAGRAAGRGVGRLVQRQITLERRIREHDRMRRAGPAGDPVEPVRLADLAGALGPAALLEFVIHDGVLHVLTVAGGRCRLRRLAALPAVVELVDRITFTLRRLGHPAASAASRAAAGRLLRFASAALDDLLLGPPAGEIGDRPLIVVPTGPLQSLPWSVLPSCAGRPVTVAPSATLWHRADSTAGPPGRRVSVGYGLPGAVAEAARVGALHDGEVITDGAATVDAVTRAMNGAALAHLAAHGRVQPHNPLFSSLMLADGPLTVYDIERLDRVPSMVVLASCDSGRTAVRAGDEVLGISATLLSRGTRQVVASVVPVPDVETTPLMIAFHERLLAGRTAPQALAETQARFAGTDGSGAAAAAGFVCVGAAAGI